MKLKLDQLEARLQSLVESRLADMLPGLKAEDRIVQKLAGALKQNVVDQKGEGAIAPNVFTLIVAPDSSPMWKEQRTIDALKEIIAGAGSQVGLKFTTPPTITITTDENYTSEDIGIVASHKLEPVADTQGMETTGAGIDAGAGENIPENAFLIIEGVKVHALTEPVVNIGRRLENHLVIDDPRVSRNHAQLRSIKGRFVLFDLNSTGGTFVNGQRTSQTVLYPGDVISLAGVALIFGQDNPPVRPDLAETSPFDSRRPDPGASDRPTAAGEHQTIDIRIDRLRQDKPGQ
ncbi:MAG TPA: FHA domain-containing protein [Anaerolineales bacterium]|nr:FHA domain-containing protein [Anaerolineales bacterium]